MERKMKNAINQPMNNQGVSQELSEVAYATITKWGNSQGIRIPRTLTSILGIKLNEQVEIGIENNAIYIKKSLHYKNITERLESFYQKPIDDIFVQSTEEVDWGTPEGDEIW